VIGGGLAGITAAIALAESGADVTLLEARPRLGGATCSFSRDGLTVDTGQHIFLGCCSAYRGLLDRLGMAAHAPIQPRFDVTVLAPGKRAALKRRRVPAPLHMLPALLGYPFLSNKERARLALAALAFKRLDENDPKNDELPLGDWLAAHGQDERTRRVLWDLFSVSSLNVPGDDASLALATVPFTIEGPIRRQLAEAQLQLLRKRVDGVVTFSNDRLLQVARDLPLAKAFAALGAVMARPATTLSAVLARTDVVPLRRMLKQVREWRFGLGAGQEKHRCFLAVEEAYASPWFTSLPEELLQAIALISSSRPETDATEVLREIQMRSPKAAVAWAVQASPPEDDRVVVQLLGGV